MAVNKELFYIDEYMSNDNITAKVFSDNTGNPNQKPLFTGYMDTDQFELSVAHSWSNESTLIDEITKKATNTENQILKNIRSGARLVGSQSLNNYSNIKVVSTSEYYRSFQGTEISYPGLDVNLVLVTDTSERNIQSEFYSLLENFIGKFEATGAGSINLSGSMYAPNNFSYPASFGDDIPGSYQIFVGKKGKRIKNLLISEVTSQISEVKCTNGKPLFIKAKFKFITGGLVQRENLKDILS